MKTYLAPILALVAAVVGTVGDTHDQQGLTPLGWASVFVAAVGALVIIWTIMQQGNQIRLNTAAWKRSLQSAVRQNLGVLSYLNFSARQYALQVVQLRTDRMTGTVVDFARGMPNGWGKDLPPRERLSSDLEINFLRAYRVDPPRGIGGLWASPVPYGTDRRNLPILVSQETALGLEKRLFSPIRGCREALM
jgi:hypothetical protein